VNKSINVNNKAVNSLQHKHRMYICDNFLACFKRNFFVSYVFNIIIFLLCACVRVIYTSNSPNIGLKMLSEAIREGSCEERHCDLRMAFICFSERSGEPCLEYSVVHIEAILA